MPLILRSPEFPGGAGAPVTTSGRERESDTHGMAASGTTATTATETVLGTLTLPANGPWKIFGLWGQIVPATGSAAEFVGGFMRINALSGDLDPDPAPTRYPLTCFGSQLGATLPVQVSPLKIWPITFTAPGKAQIQLIHDNPIAITVAPQMVMGILFGHTVPQMQRYRYVDRIRTTVTAATDTQIGTIQLAEKATRITHVSCSIAQDGVLTAGEELLGFFRLDSDDIKMTPMQLPCSVAFGAGLGATIGNNVPVVPEPIPVNIPVVGGARIDGFIDLNSAVTNGAEVEICVFYE